MISAAPRMRRRRFAAPLLIAVALAVALSIGACRERELWVRWLPEERRFTREVYSAPSLDAEDDGLYVFNSETTSDGVLAHVHRSDPLPAWRARIAEWFGASAAGCRMYQAVAEDRPDDAAAGDAWYRLRAIEGDERPR